MFNSLGYSMPYILR